MQCFFLLYVTGVVSTLQGIEAQGRNYYQQTYSSYGRPSISTHVVNRDDFIAPSIAVDNVKDIQSVELDIYYETNCRDSMRFITHQLFPLYKEMKDVVKIRLVPFGKASAEFNERTKLYDFQCHFGPSECYGNTIQSCAISLYPNPDDHLAYVNCMEEYPRPPTAAQKCARRNSLNWDKIVKCAEGEEGNRLLYENSKLTGDLNPPLHFVPWIVVNKVYSPEQQRKAIRNLKEVVCDKIKNQHSNCGRYS